MIQILKKILQGHKNTDDKKDTAVKMKVDFVHEAEFKKSLDALYYVIKDHKITDYEKLTVKFKNILNCIALNKNKILFYICTGNFLSVYILLLIRKYVLPILQSLDFENNINLDSPIFKISNFEFYLTMVSLIIFLYFPVSFLKFDKKKIIIFNVLFILDFVDIIRFIFIRKLDLPTIILVYLTCIFFIYILVKLIKLF